MNDSPDIQVAAGVLYVDEDFPVFTALSGEEGLETQLSNPAIGLIISGQRMPGMTGAEFLARVRNVSPEALRALHLALIAQPFTHNAFLRKHQGMICDRIRRT